MLKPFTSHNDKLGYDWSVANRNYVPELNSKHFAVSRYKEFKEKAVAFTKDVFPEHSSHLEKALAAERFTA